MPNNRDEQSQLPPRFVKMGEIWAKFGFWANGFGLKNRKIIKSFISAMNLSWTERTSLIINQIHLMLKPMGGQQ